MDVDVETKSNFGNTGCEERNTQAYSFPLNFIAMIGM